MYEHGFAYARSVTFYNSTLVWRWMRLPGDVVFAIGALLMAWDFFVNVGPLFPSVAPRLRLPPLQPYEQPAESRGGTQLPRIGGGGHQQPAPALF